METDDEKLTQCPGCSARFPKAEGAENRYGVASQECWAAFNQMLAHERNSWGYPDVHRLVVDAYGIQHPQNFELQKQLGIEQRFIDASVQSVAIHLIALHFAIVEKKELKTISRLMSRILSNGAKFPVLTPPDDLGAITVVDAPYGESLEEYSRFAWGWANDAWSAWSAYHPEVKRWIEKYLV